MESLADIEVCIEAHTSLYRRLSSLYTGDRVRCAAPIYTGNSAACIEEIGRRLGSFHG